MLADSRRRSGVTRMGRCGVTRMGDDGEHGGEVLVRKALSVRVRAVMTIALLANRI